MDGDINLDITTRPPRPLSSLRVAVVGFGSIGRRHCDNLARLGVTRRAAVRRRTGANPAFVPPADVELVHDSDAALEGGLDLAIICNPTRWHVDVAQEYIEAGVPVLIEKPISDEIVSAKRLLAEEARTGGWAGMAYALRYQPAYRLAREAVLAGRIGRVLYAKTWFEGYLPDWHPWEDYRRGYAARRDLGGGVLPTLDHELDYLNWCFGAAESASGWSANTGALGTDTDDVANVTIRYGAGLIANATFSLCRRDPCRGFEFVGSEATLRMRFESARLERLAGPDRPPEVLWHDAGYEVNEMYLEMLRDSLTALVKGDEPPVPLEAGLDALRLALGHAAPGVMD